MLSRLLRAFLLILVAFSMTNCGSRPKLAEEETWDTVADAKRMSQLEPDEFEWEKKLERKLDDYSVAVYKNLKLKGKESPYDFVRDDPKLPRILLIGDQLSLDYTIKLRKKLSGIANVHRVPENCGSSAKGVVNIKRWVARENWDLIHFNFGADDKESSPYEYAQNLRQIVRVLKRKKTKLIWSNTVPTKPREISIALNKIAEKTMKSNGIYINDIYSEELPFINDDQNTGESLSDDGLNTVVKKITEAIKSQLIPE